MLVVISIAWTLAPAVGAQPYHPPIHPEFSDQRIGVGITYHECDEGKDDECFNRDGHCKNPGTGYFFTEVRVGFRLLGDVYSTTLRSKTGRFITIGSWII